MTEENAKRIGAAWLASKPWGQEWEVTGVQIEDDLALVFYGLRSRDLVAGNAPLLIDLATGKIHVTGTAGGMDYIQNFRVTGDPHIEPVAAVKIMGWSEGARKVSAVTVLKETTQLGLIGAKAAIDAVLEGREAEVIPRKGVEARELCAKLEEVGFTAKETLLAPK